MDLIRDLLLRIESNPEMDGTREFYLNTPEEMGISGYSTEEVAYNLGLLINAGFVDGAVTIGNPMQVVRGLTWEGHEFLDNIKNDDIWAKTKKRFSNLSGVGLRIVAALAEAELKRHMGL
jgi:hypothetical protein